MALSRNTSLQKYFPTVLNPVCKEGAKKERKNSKTASKAFKVDIDEQNIVCILRELTVFRGQCGRERKCTILNDIREMWIKCWWRARQGGESPHSIRDGYWRNNSNLPKKERKMQMWNSTLGLQVPRTANSADPGAPDIRWFHPEGNERHAYHWLRFTVWEITRVCKSDDRKTN